jgi:exosortase E/protease (VPEID-CTERM system)
LPRCLLGRLYLLAAILILDCALLASIPHLGTLLGPIAPSGILAFAIFVGLGYPALKADREEVPFDGRPFCAHLLCIGVVFLYNAAALREPRLGLSVSTHIIASSLVLLGIVLLALACIPLHTWIRTLRARGSLALLASLSGAAAWWLRHPIQSFWDSPSLAHGRILQVAAFYSVRKLLGFVLPDVISDPAAFTLGTPRFLVFIAEECSGLEGLGLVLIFTLVWLWHFRKETRFPRALVLVPCALACVWLLNIARISAIILIGDAGAPDVAMVGFHSQAGWIAFTAVALTFSMATRKLSWLQRAPASAVHPSGDSAIASRPATAEEAAESPETAAYLLPFLAILAASFISRGASGYFEWLYPLRFIAAAITLWYFRSEYRKLDWRFGGMAPAIGAGIFLLWIAPALWMHERPASPLGPALAALSPSMRAAWVFFRIAAAIITVPIAEELAFRGYLARRIISRNFDEASFRSLTAFSVCLSSAAFGVMHGSHWFVGIVAGLAYAVVLKWRGRIGDAIVAHATSNLLLAAWVLIRGLVALVEPLLAAIRAAPQQPPSP